MNRYTLSLLLILNAFACQSQIDKLHMPAEWEKQKAIFVNYSGNPRDVVTSEKLQAVCREIVRELSAFTKVYVLINEEFDQDSLLRVFASKGIQTNNVILLSVYKLFSMGVPRDYGPIITKDKKRPE